MTLAQADQILDRGDNSFLPVGVGKKSRGQIEAIILFLYISWFELTTRDS